MSKKSFQYAVDIPAGLVVFLVALPLCLGMSLATAAVSIPLGNLKNSYFFHKDQHHGRDIIKIKLSEEVSFLNKASIRATLDHKPENTTVSIDASNSKYIDFDVLEIIKEFRDIKSPLKNIKCNLVGFKEAYKIENTSHVISSH